MEVGSEITIPLLKGGVTVGAVVLVVHNVEEASVDVRSITYPDPVVESEIRRRIRTNEDRIRIYGGTTPKSLSWYPEGILRLLKLMATESADFGVTEVELWLPNEGPDVVY